MNKILFTLIYLDEDHLVQTFSGEYRNLKDLIQEKFFPEDFGQCGGVGRCATCMVELIDTQTSLKPMKRNEETTLSRHSRKGSVRLSCQIEIDDDLMNQNIKVLDVLY